MQAISLAGLLIFLFATTSIGLRLLWLWFKTHELPELTLATAYLAGGPLGWTLTLVGSLTANLHTPLGLTLRTIGVFFLSLGSVGLFAGVWRIFRPEHRWIGAVCALYCSVLVADFVRNAVLHGTPFLRANEPWFWPGSIGRSLPFWWSTYESLRYYALLRRRLRLGLVDPALANKLLLWGISGLAASAMSVLALAGTIFDFDYRYAKATFTAYGALGMASAVAIWLAFFPPDRYLRYIAENEGRGG